ncbi:hypothetical protein AB0I81_16235 [Nonomuraea sp. NPDC050404]|uniref:hypothetical protein n=1 Tax=Nonomuraea sp. NPDC050404 TaxID=3155783 RepID=UPI0033E8F6BE
MLIVNAVASALIVTSLASPATETAYENKAEIETVRADCMKERGLKYLPEEVMKREWTKEERARVTGDPEAMRAYRAKYGFGVWSRLVFPKDPAVHGEGRESRNNKHLMSLSPSRLKSYQAADERCFAKAVKSVLGKKASSQADFLEQMGAAVDGRLRVLDQDGKLVKLGEEFASCLGVSTAKPSELAERGVREFRKQSTEVARSRQTTSVPEEKLKDKDFWMWPAMKPAQARPYLDKEVAAALADLKCGKAFYQAYLPRARAVQERVYQEYAIDFAL